MKTHEALAIGLILGFWIGLYWMPVTRSAKAVWRNALKRTREQR